jgi:hypothetical protein
MNSSEQRNIRERIDETSRITEELVHQVSDIRMMIRTLENHSRAKKLDEEGAYRQGSPDLIVYVVARTQPDPLWESLSKMSREKAGFPSLILVEQDVAASEGAREAASISKHILGDTTNGKIAVITWTHHVQPLSDTESIVLGERYVRLPQDTRSDMLSRLGEKGITVYGDEGMFGGGKLTHDLISVMEGSNTEMIFELTLPLHYVYNEEVLKTILSKSLDFEVD